MRNYRKRWTTPYSVVQREVIFQKARTKAYWATNNRQWEKLWPKAQCYWHLADMQRQTKHGRWGWQWLCWARKEISTVIWRFLIRDEVPDVGILSALQMRTNFLSVDAVGTIEYGRRHSACRERCDLERWKRSGKCWSAKASWSEISNKSTTFLLLWAFILQRLCGLKGFCKWITLYCLTCTAPFREVKKSSSLKLGSRNTHTRSFLDGLNLQRP